jgi:peptidoglycan/xylan/chitin deacetylase (PgdA/CDA1 family)
MINLSPPRFFQRFFKNVIWNFPLENEGVFLTFDDGPTPNVTTWVLEQLRKYNAKATFFCLAKNVEMHPDIFDMITADGHAVGNHTYSHIKGWGTDTTQYVQDVIYANSFVKSNLYRPPYGRITPKQFNLLKSQYKIIFWDVLSMDYTEGSRPARFTSTSLGMPNPARLLFFTTR